MTKEQLRLRMKQLRSAMTQNQIEEKSNYIADRLFTMAPYSNADCVMTYLSAFHEPDTLRIIRHCFAAGKRIVVPISETQSHTLRLSYIDSLSCLKSGAYGILEPETEVPALPDAPDLILVPGVAFDRHGGRLGFGVGYYDRFLASCRAVKVGLCYDFQLIDRIPCDTHDIPMDYILTEKECLNCGGNHYAF